MANTDRKFRKALLASFIGGALVFGGGAAVAQLPDDEDYDAVDDYDDTDDYDDVDDYDAPPPPPPPSDPDPTPIGTDTLPRTGGAGALLLAGGAAVAGTAAARRFLLNR